MKLFDNISGALRTAVLSILICSGAYTLVIWLFAQVFFPGSANGSLVQNVTGEYVGSRQIAQKFTSEKYFHSRPPGSDGVRAVSAGSNLSPASPELTARAQQTVKQYGASEAAPLPLDMATVSGSGLDPHITLAAAKYQIPRVAKARAMSENEVLDIVNSHVEYPGGIIRNEPIVNVLMLNLALDEQKTMKR